MIFRVTKLRPGQVTMTLAPVIFMVLSLQWGAVSGRSGGRWPFVEEFRMPRRECRQRSEDLSQMNPHRRLGGSAVAVVHRRDDRRVLTDENRKRRRVLHAEIAHTVHLRFCIFDGTPCRRPAGHLGETLVELLVEQADALPVLRALRAPLACATDRKSSGEGRGC